MIEKLFFRCNPVLPLTYDDSLSFYELLCKVVYKLNEVIEDEQLLRQEFAKLKDWVENYLDNINFQELVNKKIDELVTDGTMAKIINEQIFGELNDRIKAIEDYLPEFATTVNEKIDALNADVERLKNTETVPNLVFEAKREFRDAWWNYNNPYTSWNNVSDNGYTPTTSGTNVATESLSVTITNDKGDQVTQNWGRAQTANRMQGGCRFYLNGTPLYAVAYWNNTIYSYTNSEQVTTLNEYGLNRNALVIYNANGSIRSIAGLNVYWCYMNGMCYNPTDNSLYIACRGRATVGSKYGDEHSSEWSGRIVRVKLTENGSIDTASTYRDVYINVGNYTAIFQDFTTDESGNVYAIENNYFVKPKTTTSGNQSYTYWESSEFNSYPRIYLIAKNLDGTLNFNNLTEVARIRAINTNYQCFSVTNNYIYVTYTAPSSIAIYRRNPTGKETKVIDTYKKMLCKPFFEDRYPCGEIQWIQAYNNNAVFFGSSCSAKTSNVNNEGDNVIGLLQQVFQVNLFQNSPTFTPAISGQNVTDYLIISYLEDDFGTVHHYNPNGTSENPFDFSFEATICSGTNYLLFIRQKSAIKQLYVCGGRVCLTFIPLTENGSANTQVHEAYFKDCDLTIVATYHDTYGAQGAMFMGKKVQVSQGRSYPVPIVFTRCTARVHAKQIIAVNNKLFNCEYSDVIFKVKDDIASGATPNIRFLGRVYQQTTGD